MIIFLSCKNWPTLNCWHFATASQFNINGTLGCRSILYLSFDIWFNKSVSTLHSIYFHWRGALHQRDSILMIAIPLIEQTIWRELVPSWMPTILIGHQDHPFTTSFITYINVLFPKQYLCSHFNANDAFKHCWSSKQFALNPLVSFHLAYVLSVYCLLVGNTVDAQLTFNSLLWTQELDQVVYTWHKMADN